MDRRDFLAPKRKKQRPAQNFRTQSGLNPYTGPWTKNEVQHLLKRTMFGSTKADITYFLARTMDQAIDELLTPTAPLPAPPVNDYSPGTADASVAAGATWVNYTTSDGTLNSVRRASFKKWWAGRDDQPGQKHPGKTHLILVRSFWYRNKYYRFFALCILASCPACARIALAISNN